MADVCHKCNKPTRPNAKFCASCGTRLGGDSNSPSSMSTIKFKIQMMIFYFKQYTTRKKKGKKKTTDTFMQLKYK